LLFWHRKEHRPQFGTTLEHARQDVGQIYAYPRVIEHPRIDDESHRRYLVNCVANRGQRFAAEDAAIPAHADIQWRGQWTLNDAGSAFRDRDGAGVIRSAISKAC
jgi:hypothetical protein